MSELPRPNRTVAVLVIAGLVLCLIGAVPVVTAQEDRPPSTPAAYYGNVTIGGEPAPAGTEITAVIDGTERGRITTGTDGRYGGASATAKKLVVDGTNGDDGATVTFYVNGERATPTSEWSAGDITELALSAPESATDDDGDDGNSNDGDTGDDGSGGDSGSGGNGAGGGSGGGDSASGGESNVPSSGPDESTPTATVSTAVPTTDEPTTPTESGTRSDTPTTADGTASEPTPSPKTVASANDDPSRMAGSATTSDVETTGSGPGFDVLTVLAATLLATLTARVGAAD